MAEEVGEGDELPCVDHFPLTEGPWEKQIHIPGKGKCHTKGYVFKINSITKSSTVFSFEN